MSAAAEDNMAARGEANEESLPVPVVRRWTLEYSSRFEEWEERAVVRTSHSIVPFADELLFFSPALVPLFMHPGVRDAPKAVQRQILVLSLFDWLEFTVWLETGPVNDSCDLLRRAHFLPWLPPQMRADALKIYTDEAGHAQMAYDLRQAVEDATGVKSLQLRPMFLDTFEELVNDHGARYEPILTLCFAIVSETLITGSLKLLPRDQEVQKAVRDFARHHAEDEARHHHYFRELCVMLWPRMPYELRRVLGPLLPRMMLAFLSPNHDSMVHILSQFPETFMRPGQIVSELLSSDEAAASLRHASLPTLRMFGSCGVFNDHEVLDSFVGHGFAPPPSVLERRTAS